MPGNRKSQKSGAEKSAQLNRSMRNKQNRVARNKLIKANRQSPWYIRAKAGNRLRRLKRRVLDRELHPDRKPYMVDRINQLEKMLN